MCSFDFLRQWRGKFALETSQFNRVMGNVLIILHQSNAQETKFWGTCYLFGCQEQRELKQS